MNLWDEPLCIIRYFLFLCTIAQWLFRSQTSEVILWPPLFWFPSIIQNSFMIWLQDKFLKVLLLTRIRADNCFAIYKKLVGHLWWKVIRSTEISYFYTKERFFVLLFICPSLSSLSRFISFPSCKFQLEERDPPFERKDRTPQEMIAEAEELRELFASSESWAPVHALLWFCQFCLPIRAPEPCSPCLDVRTKKIERNSF